MAIACYQYRGIITMLDGSHYSVADRAGDVCEGNSSSGWIRHCEQQPEEEVARYSRKIPKMSLLCQPTGFESDRERRAMVLAMR